MKFIQWSIASTVILVLGASVFWLTRDDASAKHALPAKLQCELPPSSNAAPRPGMVWIPEGVFDMGDSVYAEEKPVRNVRVKCHDWIFVTMPPEERVKSLDDR